MPYLTLWNEISQNLTNLAANSHKIFQISQNFQTILQHILWRNKHKSHFVVFITSFLRINKGFWLLWGSSKVIFVKISQNFIKSPLKICLISQTSIQSLWHVLYRKTFNHQLNYLDLWLKTAWVYELLIQRVLKWSKRVFVITEYEFCMIWWYHRTVWFQHRPFVFICMLFVYRKIP